MNRNGAETSATATLAALRVPRSGLVRSLCRRLGSVGALNVARLPIVVHEAVLF